MRTVIVAVDFGTTFSGIAYSDPFGRTSEAIPITEWKPAGISSQKVPTEIRFEENGSSKWGFQIKNNQSRHSWFKLDLESQDDRIPNETTLSRLFRDTLSGKLQDNDGRQHATVNIVSAYLNHLRRHTYEVLHRRFGAEWIGNCRVEWVITVPAVWSESAKSKTRNAAIAAGMGDLTKLMMTSEPEAAATYALSVADLNTFKVNESVVICDAGGGTVDLITYKILSMEPPYRVEESTIGEGSKCGSTYLNRRFEQFLRDKLGEDVKQNAMAHGKRTFGLYEDAQEEDEISVPLPGIPDDVKSGVFSGLLTVSYHEMKEIFDPVIDEVIKLIKAQIAAAKTAGRISAVILVGGFGESRYLFRRVEQAVSPITVITPPNAWTAIVRGAVMKARAEVSATPTWMVASRFCRADYGMSYNTDWVDGEGMPLKNKSWDEYEGKWLCTDKMEWTMQRGERLQESQSKPYSYYRKKSLGSSMIFEDTIYRHFSPDKGAPVYLNSTCEPLCTITSDLSNVPKSKFIKKLGHNEEYYYLVSFEIRATTYSAEIRYELWFQKQKYGEVNAKFSD